MDARSPRPGRSSRLGLLAGAALALAGDAQAQASATDPHAHHQAPASSAVQRATASYEVPDVMLVRADGTKVRAREELGTAGPVILNFIFTTCTSICPVMTQTFAQLDGRLGAERSNVRLVSISIDPEQDTPARLREYAKKFSAGPRWTFLTGTVEASLALQKAFDVYRGDKMNHAPVTFLRAGAGKAWVRLDGFAPASAVLQEYRELVAAR
jgi:protein SCO1